MEQISTEPLNIIMIKVKSLSVIRKQEAYIEKKQMLNAFHFLRLHLSLDSSTTVEHNCAINIVLQAHLHLSSNIKIVIMIWSIYYVPSTFTFIASFCSNKNWSKWVYIC